MFSLFFFSPDYMISFIRPLPALCKCYNQQSGNKYNQKKSINGSDLIISQWKMRVIWSRNWTKEETTNKLPANKSEKCIRKNKRRCGWWFQEINYNMDPAWIQVNGIQCYWCTSHLVLKMVSCEGVKSQSCVDFFLTIVKKKKHLYFSFRVHIRFHSLSEHIFTRLYINISLIFIKKIVQLLYIFLF